MALPVPATDEEFQTLFTTHMPARAMPQALAETLKGQVLTEVNKVLVPAVKPGDTPATTTTPA